MYIDTNVQLAIAAARQVRLYMPMAKKLLQHSVRPDTHQAMQRVQIRKSGRTVHIVVPDATEFKRSYKL